jgi:hypothetical protein
MVHIDDPLHVGLQGRAGQRVARLRLHLAAELLVLDVPVAFERHAVDHRGFDYEDQKAAAVLLELDVREQSGGIERFQACIDRYRIEVPARPKMEIGADGLAFHAAIALHDDG